jgi:hypothetical protein
LEIFFLDIKGCEESCRRTTVLKKLRRNAKGKILGEPVCLAKARGGRELLEQMP